jgi:predicted nucleic acid-binding protein
VALICWDTNLFIYVIEDHPEFGERVRALWRRMDSRGDRLAATTLTLGEVLVQPIRAGEPKLAQQYQDLLSPPDVQLLDFNAKAAYALARIRQHPAIKPPDAIQLACAAAAGVDLFITNDERLCRYDVPGIGFIASLARSPL